jgi:dCTP diphosphatase
MSKPDTLADLTAMIVRFRDERDWRQFHNPKDMAISLTLEAAELLELTQWKNGEDLDAHLASRKNAVAEELSDVLYWTLLLAHELQIDLADAFSEKMNSNELKYPVDKAKGSHKKYTDLSD